MTASGTVGQECAGGNCSTAGRRQRKKKWGGRHVRREQERRKGRSFYVRVGTLSLKERES